MRKNVVLSVLLFIALQLGYSNLYATLFSTQDTFARDKTSGSPDPIFGTYNYLMFGTDNYTYDHVVLFQFDLSAESAGAVKDAYIQLYCFTTTGLDLSLVTLVKINESWDENTVTWNNQPQTDSISLLYNVKKSTDLVNWEITSLIDTSNVFYRFYLNSKGNDLISSWLDGSLLNYGLMFKIDSGNDTANFAPKEYTGIYTNRKAQLGYTYDTSIPEPLSLILLIMSGISLCIKSFFKQR
ncbi:MAG: DNRLRE domain-containing protein [Candidatus Auribacterota bacterium]